MLHSKRRLIGSNVEDDEGYVKDLYLTIDRIRLATLRAE